MGAQIMRREAQAYDQPFVAEYSLFITENWICELRVKCRQGLRLFSPRLHQCKVNSIIGVASPCAKQAQLAHDDFGEGINILASYILTVTVCHVSGWSEEQ